MFTLTLKDGSQREYDENITFLEVAKSISNKLAKNAVAAVWNGKTCGLSEQVAGDGEVEFVDFTTDAGRRVYRHSSSHIMAQAVKRLWPDTKVAIGPAIEKGFYYDFDSTHVFTPEDFPLIEKEMEKIEKENHPIVRHEISRAEALAMFQAQDEIYKVELIEGLPEDAVISIYEQGDFTDLCAGPHVPGTGNIKNIHLMSVAGAYWRGSEKNKMLQRLYATSFPKKADLDDYITKLEEAKRRDHRKLGKELGLFLLMDEGPGFPFFLPKGMVLRNTLIDYWREVHKRYGYVEISTPMILNRALWERSGHWAHYKENMYTTVIDEEDFAIKPMNCPGGMLVYKSEPHSYRDLPLRVGELGLVHRHELSGALHGLFRVRCFTQDDAHIFMTWEQMKDEIKNVVRLFDEVYSVFGLQYKIEVSTMPEDHMGDEATWDFATETLKQAVAEMGKDYEINEGDGAFYGPKLDFHLADSLDRTWQCGTIQLDMQLPERFELEYTGSDGEKHRPAMVHRVVLGSIERFIGVITEHFGGAFPTWLAPVQAKLIPITEKQRAYAEQVAAQMDAQGIRVEVDVRSEKLGYKIREGQLQKIPYLLIVGEKEVENGQVAVRHRKKGDQGAMAVDDFIAALLQEVRTRSID